MKKLRLTAVLVFALLSFSLTGFVSQVNAGEKRIRILYVNDFHGFSQPYRPYGMDDQWGGAAFLDKKIRALRADPSIPTLLLAAGDMIQGNNWANLFQGRSVIELMNLMAFDAMVMGNHELDFGQDVLKQRIREAAFPVLAANVQGLPELKPYMIKELDGIKIAVIGLVTEHTPTCTHPANAVGLTFISPIKVLKTYLPELRRTADVVIVLSHLGHDVDRFLAGQVSGVDAIIGGHSHTRVAKPPRIGNTLVLQAWEHGRALGVLDLTVEEGRVTDSSSRLIDVKPEDGAAGGSVAELVQRYQQRMDAVWIRLSAGPGSVSTGLKCGFGKPILVICGRRCPADCGGGGCPDQWGDDSREHSERARPAEGTLFRPAVQQLRRGVPAARGPASSRTGAWPCPG